MRSRCSARAELKSRAAVQICRGWRALADEHDALRHRDNPKRSSSSRSSTTSSSVTTAVGRRSARIDIAAASATVSAAALATRTLVVVVVVVIVALVSVVKTPFSITLLLISRYARKLHARAVARDAAAARSAGAAARQRAFLSGIVNAARAVLQPPRHSAWLYKAGQQVELAQLHDTTNIAVPAAAAAAAAAAARLGLALAYPRIGWKQRENAFGAQRFTHLAEVERRENLSRRKDGVGRSVADRAHTDRVPACPARRPSEDMQEELGVAVAPVAQRLGSGSSATSGSSRSGGSGGSRRSRRSDCGGGTGTTTASRARVGWSTCDGCRRRCGRSRSNATSRRRRSASHRARRRRCRHRTRGRCRSRSRRACRGSRASRRACGHSSSGSSIRRGRRRLQQHGANQQPMLSVSVQFADPDFFPVEQGHELDAKTAPFAHERVECVLYAGQPVAHRCNDHDRLVVAGDCRLLLLLLLLLLVVLLPLLLLLLLRWLLLLLLRCLSYLLRVLVLVLVLVLRRWRKGQGHKLLPLLLLLLLRLLRTRLHTPSLCSPAAALQVWQVLAQPAFDMEVVDAGCARRLVFARDPKHLLRLLCDAVQKDAHKRMLRLERGARVAP
jgi:hypothetical protein